MSAMPRFDEFVDYCLRQRRLPDLERAQSVGPTAAVLDHWNLTHDEWQSALARAIAEYRESGPRGKAA